MGFWGSVAGFCARVCAKTWGGVKKVAKAVAKPIVKAAKFVGHCVNKVWKKVSGKEDFEKAEKLLEQLEERTRRRKKEYEECMQEKTKEINSVLARINNCRKQLNEVAFPRFCSLAGNFRNWSVADVGFERKIKLKGGCDNVRMRSELMKIDFRNHPITSNLLAVVTLGFLTRKRAKESLLEVKAESRRMGQEFRKLENEKVRIDGVIKSLKQVEKYFTGCLEVYDKVLDEVDYSVTMLKTSRNLLVGVESDGQFDVEFLPERHLLALKAADEATRIAFAIGNRKYVTNSEKIFDIDHDDVCATRKNLVSCNKIEELLAA